MDLAKWQTIPIPKGLVERIDEFLQSDTAKKMGLGSRPQLMAYLIRDFLDKWESETRK